MTYLRWSWAPMLCMAVAGCSDEVDNEGEGEDDDAGEASGVICTKIGSVALDATAAPEVEEGDAVDVQGSVVAPMDVTVRWVEVASVTVQRDQFNFRGWSVTLGADVVAAYTADGLATLPVTAYTSKGCVQKADDEALQVTIVSTSEEGGGGVGGTGSTGGVPSGGGA